MLGFLLETSKNPNIRTLYRCNTVGKIITTYWYIIVSAQPYIIVIITDYLIP